MEEATLSSRLVAPIGGTVVVPPGSPRAFGTAVELATVTALADDYHLLQREQKNLRCESIGAPIGVDSSTARCARDDSDFRTASDRRIPALFDSR